LGLELAREHLPDLVLLDLHLPDIGGDEVLRRLRDDPHTASIPVVILSADATPGQIQRLLHAGASEYLTKPLDVRQLREVLGRLTSSPADTTLKV
jgi:CheY-like chemotaxis protein